MLETKGVILVACKEINFTSVFSQGGTAQNNELLEVRICYVSFLLSAIAAFRALHGQCGPPLV